MAVEIFALEIFHQSDLHRLVVARIADHDGHLAEAGAHSGTPAPFAGNQLETVILGANYQRLDDALIANRRRQFVDLGFVETASWLKWTGGNPVDGNLFGRTVL